MAIRKRQHRPDLAVARLVTNNNEYMIHNYVGGLSLNQGSNPIGLFISYYKDRVGFSSRLGTYTLDSRPMRLNDIYKKVNEYRECQQLAPVAVPYFFNN